MPDRYELSDDPARVDLDVVWGYLGSDFYTKGARSDRHFCDNPATMTMLTDSSRTVLYGTSSFFYGTWMPQGDGRTYRYVFVDPPKSWFGNPTLDFRHMGTKTIDSRKHEVNSTGVAMLLFADGHVKPQHQREVKNIAFERDSLADQP